MNTTERRKLYTPEQLEAERLYTIRYRQENKALLAKRGSDRRAAGKCKGTSHYRQAFTPEQREAELAYKRQHYQETREKQLACAAEYRERNRQLLREKQRGSYGRNIAYHNAYRAKNADHIRAIREVWTETNRERIKQLNAEWQKNNPERHRTHQHNRRARKGDNGGILSPDISGKLFSRQRGRCACCGVKLGKTFDIDHIVPLALGGPNTDDNVQLLTPRCNRQKGAKHPVEFMQARGFLL